MFTEKDIERAEKMNAEVWVVVDKEIEQHRNMINVSQSNSIEAERIIAQNHINEFFFKKLAQLENQIENLRNKNTGGKLK